jgi:BirA family transcriptional regulator, biotin operon repressor / biotin---[acetyl-CoA-carboxylase] ligase
MQNIKKNYKEDILDPSEIHKNLRTAFTGKDIIYLERTESTNITASDLAKEGAAEGTLVVTEEQTSGKGRLGRTWLSPAYKNILMSLIFRPSLPPEKTFFLTMISSIAIVKAVKAAAGCDTQIKWPNDIYLNSKKLAGILTEVSYNRGKMNYAVIGTGINVNFDAAAYPQITNTATSLFTEYGKVIPRIHLLCGILEETEAGYNMLKQNNFAAIREEWEKHSLILGKQVTIISGDLREHGTAESIKDDGSLIIKSGNGELKTFKAGDVSLRLK